MLARRAATEVFFGNNDVTGLYVVDELDIQILQAVLGKFGRLRSSEVASRDDNVGINIATVAMNCSLELHYASPN